MPIREEKNHYHNVKHITVLSAGVPSDIKLCSGDTGPAVNVYFHAFNFILFYPVCYLLAAVSIHVSL